MCTRLVLACKSCSFDNAPGRLVCGRCSIELPFIKNSELPLKGSATPRTVRPSSQSATSPTETEFSTELLTSINGFSFPSCPCRLIYYYIYLLCTIIKKNVPSPLYPHFCFTLGDGGWGVYRRCFHLLSIYLLRTCIQYIVTSYTHLYLFFNLNRSSTFP